MSECSTEKPPSINPSTLWTFLILSGLTAGLGPRFCCTRDLRILSSSIRPLTPQSAGPAQRRPLVTQYEKRSPALNIRPTGLNSTLLPLPLAPGQAGGAVLERVEMPASKELSHS